MPHSRFLASPLGLLTGLVLIDCALIVWGWRTDYGIVNENGALENLQVGVLLLAFAVSAINAYKNDGAEETFSILCCFLFCAFILKELEFKELIVKGPKDFYWEENVLSRSRKALLFLIPVPVIVFAALRRRHLPALIRDMTLERVWPFCVCALILLLTQFLEAEGFRPPKGLSFLEYQQALRAFHAHLSFAKFWEESGELNAYLLLLYGVASDQADKTPSIGDKESNESRSVS